MKADSFASIAVWYTLCLPEWTKGDTVSPTSSNDRPILPAQCKTRDLLYAANFPDMARQKEKEQQREWIMEGGGIATWSQGILRLRSRSFTVKRTKVETDHFVYWLNRDFPANFAVTWDFRFAPIEQNPEGLAIIFFSAMGLHGEDLFDPRLQKRDGIFERSYDGDINCYHTSYLALGRGTSNLRKNKGFHLPASGEDLVARGGAEKWHKLQVTRFEGLVELRVNGEVSFAWDDDGKTYGPRLGGGKLGFRQQNNLLWGDYTNVRVWELTRG